MFKQRFALLSALSIVFSLHAGAWAHRIGDDQSADSTHAHSNAAAAWEAILGQIEARAAARRAHAVADSGIRSSASPMILGIEPPKTSAQPEAKAPAAAAPFQAFGPAVGARWDDQYLYVESNSMPDHLMMVGITAWQQQVPIPQPYTGANAWRIPLHPVVAKNPMSAKSHFFKGAIALAANGIPIFNPIKTNGKTDTFLAGELDQFGGHCGRADDYHYHIPPVHLQKIVGPGKPIAYALDGYPILGFNESDGSAAGKLDEMNGHDSGAGYHYHATKDYPYLNGGFHGEVVERNGQVDPQPRAQGVREYLPPLPGAKITGFTSKDNKQFSVKYEVGAETRFVNYTLNDNGTVQFDFVDGNGQVKTETYSPRQRGSGGDRPREEGKGKGKGKGDPKRGPGKGAADDRRPEAPRQVAQAPAEKGKGDRRERGGEPRKPRDDVAPSGPPFKIDAKRTGNFKLTSTAVADGQELPKEFNGDGEGATLPLEWKGAPAETKSFALIMDHIDRDNICKCYWTMYDIPATVTSLPKNVKGVGKLGATWKRGWTYVTPHSAGGAKATYTLTVYALSAVPQIDKPQDQVTREVLLTAIKDSILDSAELKVTYTRPPGERQGNDKGKGKGKGKDRPADSKKDSK